MVKNGEAPTQSSLEENSLEDEDGWPVEEKQSVYSKDKGDLKSKKSKAFESFDQFQAKQKRKEEEKQKELDKPFKGAVIDPIKQMIARNKEKQQRNEESSEEDEYENFAWFKASKETQAKMEPDTYVAFYNDI